MICTHCMTPHTPCLKLGIAPKIPHLPALGLKLQGHKLRHPESSVHFCWRKLKILKWNDLHSLHDSTKLTFVRYWQQNLLLLHRSTTKLFHLSQLHLYLCHFSPLSISGGTVTKSSLPKLHSHGRKCWPGGWNQCKRSMVFGVTLD